MWRNLFIIIDRSHRGLINRGKFNGRMAGDRSRKQFIKHTYSWECGNKEIE